MLNELDSLEDVLDAITKGGTEKLFKIICRDGLKLNIKAHNLDHARRIVESKYEREIEWVREERL
jgi:hypothetical protein|tara:strand:+ start:5888 stop:6082 length:195 start_codon:yes stop_codon:yes gene_type:complete